MKKKILASIFAGLMALNILGGVDNAQAATRAEIAAINVQRPADFKYWSDKSLVKRQIINYVKDVTNPRSKNFIPVEDRIAVFDMDGTILCETAPTSFGCMFALYTILEDPTPTITEEYRAKAKIWQDDLLTKGEIDKEFHDYTWNFCEGMTDEDFKAHMKKFMTQNVIGLTNLKYGEGFYLPMVEIISYLNANDFTVYIVTGSGRDFSRVLLDGAVDVKTNHVIGGDIPYTFENNVGEKYYVKGDRILMGKGHANNTHTNKIFSIKREIGKQPVLAFGNSSGDNDVLNYTIVDNKYKSVAFVLLCDDFTREIGNRELADKMRDAAQKNGWTTISMKDDFKTIYGDNVKLSKK
ncbi:MAG: haloacid dehalogenase-like hydrolase [Selenomonadaceae bacterium]|nr:haloacid dehalogenase-like hydrolase [Selenomonadaceae bacterium]